MLLAVAGRVDNKPRRNLVNSLKEVMIFQPNPTVTAEMFLAIADQVDNQRPDQRPDQLFDTLLRHMPHADVMDKVIKYAMESDYHIGMLRSILATRPNHGFSRSSIITICNHSDGSHDFQAVLDQVMSRSHNTGLGESEMLDVITQCSPKGLLEILSRRSEAVVTDNVIKRLIDTMIENPFSQLFVLQLSYRRSYRHPRYIDEVFDMLLARSGLPEVPCQLLRYEFQKAQDNSR